MKPGRTERATDWSQRAVRAVAARVDRMFSPGGPGFKQLALSFTANFAGDTLVAIGLAGTLFFSVPSSRARDQVALYLLLTLAPFSIVGPLLGALFRRYPNAYRAVLVASSTARVALALALAVWLETLWLFPLAFGLLVFSRLYGISKNTLLPVALTEPVALVAANARLTRLGIIAGALAAPVGAAAMELVGGWLSLVLAAACFIASAVAGARIPAPRVDFSRPLPKSSRPPPGPPELPRALLLSRVATAVVRLLNGFLLLLLAFAFRDAEAGLLDFGALLAAGGFGFGLASYLSPWLERRLREEPMVVAALAVEAAAAFIAAQAFTTNGGAILPAASALAAAAGLAWGTAKFGFDGLLQQTVAPERRGIAFTRSETIFQLAWVVGALLPVVLPFPTQLGLALAGTTALAAQVLIVSGLLVSVRESR